MTTKRERTSRRGIVVLALLAALAVLAVIAQAPAVQANGTSIKVVLSYMPGVSNFGPQHAAGTAEIVMKEGEIRVAAAGLEPLSRQTYQIWLINTQSGEVFNGGRVSPDSRGSVNATNVLTSEIPDRRYNLVSLTVEEPDILPRTPGSRVAIAGYMSLEPVPGGQTPPQLPVTGGEGDGGGQRPLDLSAIRYVPVEAPAQPAGTTGPAGVGLPVAGWVLAAGAGYVLGSLRSRRERRTR